MALLPQRIILRQRDRSAQLVYSKRLPGGGAASLSICLGLYSASILEVLKVTLAGKQHIVWAKNNVKYKKDSTPGLRVCDPDVPSLSSAATAQTRWGVCLSTGYHPMQGLREQEKAYRHLSPPLTLTHPSLPWSPVGSGPTVTRTCKGAWPTAATQWALCHPRFREGSTGSHLLCSAPKALGALWC